MHKFDRVEIVRAKNGYILHAYEEDSLIVEDYVVAESDYGSTEYEIGNLVLRLLGVKEEA